MGEEQHLTEQDLQQIEARLEDFDREDRRASSNPRVLAIMQRLAYVDVLHVIMRSHDHRQIHRRLVTCDNALT
jgi:hypothetical protein